MTRPGTRTRIAARAALVVAMLATALAFAGEEQPHDGAPPAVDSATAIATATAPARDGTPPATLQPSTEDAPVLDANAAVTPAAAEAAEGGDAAPAAKAPAANDAIAAVHAESEPAADNAAAPPATEAAPPEVARQAVPAAAPPQSEGAASPTTTMPAAPEAHEKIVTNVPTLLTTVDTPKKKAWESEHGGFVASRLAIARRLQDRPDRLVTRASSLPRDREDFLWRVARDTWAGLQAYSDRDNGLIVDNVRITGGLVPPLSVKVGDYTNITNIGLQLASFAAARRLGLIADTDARAAVSRILDTLATLDRYDGYFYNYYDTTSLEPTSTFLSFVDTAWLVAGLMITRQAFPGFAKTVDELLEPIDFHWFYNDETGLMSHGYYVNLGTLSAFEYGYFYTEARLGSLIAIGKGDAPARHWYAMRRATRAPCMDGGCPELHHLRYRNSDNVEVSVAHFRWRAYEYVPSWGGSMFEALMPRLVLDEGRWAPRSLGPNGQAHAQLQKIYATEVLHLPVWGMSPCISPEDGHYHEYGVKGLGSHGYDEGVVTPHAAALALAVTPDDAAEALMEMTRRYPVYGPFGFYDSVEPVSGKVAYDQLALDQLMLFLAVANHLSGGEVPELFASDPWVRDALPLLAEERFFQ